MACFRAQAQRNANKEVPKSHPGVVPLAKGPSPIRLEVLEDWLVGYLRSADAQYLLEGFQFRFRILAEGERKAFFEEEKNLKVSKEYGTYCARKIKKKVLKVGF